MPEPMARRNLFPLMPISAFAVFAVLLMLGLARPVPLLGDGYLDRPLPPFTQPPLAGTERGLSREDLAGKISLVNVFSSWCGVCKAEHPYLMELADQEGALLYGINWRDRPGAGTAFLDQFGNPYQDTGTDATGALGLKLGVTGVPETYLVDRQGRIRYRHIGRITPEVWTGILKPLITELETRS